MHAKTLAAAAVFAALLAGCDRSETRTERSGANPSAGASQTQQQPAITTTPANTPTPNAEEKRDGANPQQGQVDPKQSEQRRDFQQPGDGAGPQSKDAQPTQSNK